MPGRAPLAAMVLEGLLQNLVARLATQGLFSSQASGGWGTARDGVRASPLWAPCQLCHFIRWPSPPHTLFLPQP